MAVFTNLSASAGYSPNISRETAVIAWAVSLQVREHADTSPTVS